LFPKCSISEKNIHVNSFITFLNNLANRQSESWTKQLTNRSKNKNVFGGDKYDNNLIARKYY